MIEIFNKNDVINIKNSQNILINFNVNSKDVYIWDYNINFPWEYEKSWILLEVMEYEGKLFYNFLVEWNTIVIIFDDNFEIKESILSFFWDVDILLINWTKNSNKIVENIETKVVIPFWELKNVFLHSISQHKEEIDTFKLKSDFWLENTEYVNLK